MKVIFMDTRAFSMARILRGLGLGSVSVFAVFTAIAIPSQVLARDSDDAFVTSPALAATTTEIVFFRPAPRPTERPAVAQVARAQIAAPSVILTAQPQDRGRIRQSWAIGVFR
jgi:hypothetical protein